MLSKSSPRGYSSETTLTLRQKENKLQMKKIKQQKREAIWNDETPRVAEVNAVLAEPIQEEGWFEISPYGQFKGREAGRIQYFGEP